MGLASIEAIRQHSLVLKLKPVYVGQLVLLEVLDRPAFKMHQGLFEVALKEGGVVTSDFLRDYVSQGNTQIYISELDFERVHEKLHNQLIKLSRTTSSTEPLANGSKQANLLSLQMANLYNNPYDNQLLKGQFQNSKNFSILLTNNKEIHSELYKRYLKQKHHYTIGQPMLSSILLLSFIQQAQMFSEKEIQGLFLTSYFKDIGMSFIPREKLDLGELDHEEKEMFADHAQASMELLEGRLPFTQTQLNMIKNHHYLNYLIQAKVKNEKVQEQDALLTGIESALMSAMDILVAMTTRRPYRDPVSLYKALEFLKQVLQDEYPAEFKSLVIFLKQFLGK